MEKTLPRLTLVVLAAAALLGLSFWGGLDRQGAEVTNELLIKGTATYAITRAAMGGLSVVEEIEFSAAVVIPLLFFWCILTLLRRLSP